MGPARRDSVPEILEPAIGDLARELAPAGRSSAREIVLGGRKSSGEIVLRPNGTVEATRGPDDTAPGLLGRGPAPGLLARGSGPIGNADEGLLARGSGPIDSDDDVAHIHAPKAEADSAAFRAPPVEIDSAAPSLFSAVPTVEIDSAAFRAPTTDSAAPTVEIDLAQLESKRVAVVAKVRANAEPQVELVDDLLLDPWFFKTEEEIAAIEDDPTARIIEIKIAPVLDVSSFDDDRWVF